MRVYHKEYKRLAEAEAFVSSAFPHFGINKKQEIVRLLYEISKREQSAFAKIITNDAPREYHLLKDSLLTRRYPSGTTEPSFKPHLPKLSFTAGEALLRKSKKFYPKNVFIEKKAVATALAGRLKSLFPKARFSYIPTLKEYRRAHGRFTIEGYNKRQENLFVVYENYDFFKTCPCTMSALPCGYDICNLSFGCVYECNYCFLQDYANSPGIILTANIDTFFEQFSRYQRPGMRLGTGEFSDSLALDWVTEYSMPLVEFFSAQKNTVFEFKTKSTMIENVLKVKASPNIVVSWSVNPQGIIGKNEFFTPSLHERVTAARRCVSAGYRVGFHFDPIIYFEGWEKEYRYVIEHIFSQIKPKDIAWISVGTFRFSPGLRQVIEKRFPDNTILDAELLLGYDNKLRYPYALRCRIYEKMSAMLKEQSQQLNVYLCMEDARMWKELGRGWNLSCLELK